MMDAVLQSNRVVTPEGMRKATILIRNGVIAAVLNEFSGTDIPITDIGNDVLMPGVIDPHVHINEPGRTEWEGFDSATKAALAGGVTTLVEMPLNASPVTTTVKAFDEKIKATKGKLHAHCGFWGGVLPGNEKEIESLIEKGVFGFKAFLIHSGIDEFPNSTEEDLRKVMPVIAKHKLPLLVHCELSTYRKEPVVGSLLSEQAGGESGMSAWQPPGNGKQAAIYRNYLASRPRIWENAAIALMIRLCEEFNCPTHIVHLSSAESIEQIAKAKQMGLPLTTETCQHYLYFCAEDIGEGQTAFKCAPPIREKENNEKLWQALKEGIIDFVATDHSPAPPSMKELQSGDFMKAWGGIASLQFSLPVLWTAAKKRGCHITDMAKWLCERTALLPQLKTKGKIEKGYDADLVAWNPEDSFTVTESGIHHRHKVTPYLGEQLYGVVRQTWLQGEKVYDETLPDKSAGHAPGRGKFLHLNKGVILYHG